MEGDAGEIDEGSDTSPSPSNLQDIHPEMLPGKTESHFLSTRYVFVESKDS